MSSIQPKILLTNDDGIESPGLWAAAVTLSEIGDLTIAAPRSQATSASRSMPITSDGIIEKRAIQYQGKTWTAYAVGGSPAQVVIHSLEEILSEPPDLVVSGINYGQNVGYSSSVSGTVGAAIEAAASGIPGLAVSLQVTNMEHVYNHSTSVDFTAAGFFTAKFARLMLKEQLPFDVDILKVEIPIEATFETDWNLVRTARHRGWRNAVQRDGNSWTTPARINGGVIIPEPTEIPHDTDVYTLYYEKKVAVSPLSLDPTSRTKLNELEERLRNAA